MNLTLGADPEVFFAYKNKPISAIGLVGGTKEEPRPLGDGYFVQEDNVAAEFNIPPASSPNEFSIYIERGLNLVNEIAQKNEFFIYKGASFSFPSEALENDKAKEFGCDPDYCAWSMMENERPIAEDTNFRTCGGHVHVGGVEHLNPLVVIRAMDLFLGVPSIVLDKDTERRKLYGKAGAFRPKVYGVEYRTLSNFWIFDPALCEWVWNATQRAVHFAETNGLIDETQEDGLLIMDAINNGNMGAYHALVEKFPEITPEV